MIHIDVDTAVTVPVNVMPLTDDSDFVTRETGVAYNAAGMDLVWNFITCNGTITQTAVTPTTGGDYDWSEVGDAMYKIEIPASGGASINNDTEGVGYFTGVATGILPWRGPDILFRAAAVNDALIEGGDNLDVNAVALATDAAEEIADAVWDELSSGHNVAGSFGKAVRQTKESVVSVESSVNDVSATTTSFITNLTEATDDHYADLSVVFIYGALVGQSRPVASYNGTTKTLTFDEPFTEAPADGDSFIIKTEHIHTVTQIASSVWSASNRALSDPAGFKKNTAGDITFVLRDSSDGRTPIASETVTAQRSIDGAAFGACANAVSEIGNGAYIITLAASDMNGDIIILRFTSTNSDDLLITIKTET